jgi:hypothetical protein
MSRSMRAAMRSSLLAESSRAGTISPGRRVQRSTSVRRPRRPSQVPIDGYQGSSESAIQRSCAGCSEQHACETCDSKKAVQLARHPTVSPVGAQAASEALAVAGRGGKPLDHAIRVDMEHRLGADFSTVRIHTDASAAASAEGIHARAYTVGETVVFGTAAYAPQTAEGRRTLAHELVHVQQQRKGPVAGAEVGAGISVSDPADHHELDAVRRASELVDAPATRIAPGARPGLAVSQGRGSAAMHHEAVAERPTSPATLQREPAPAAPHAPAPSAPAPAASAATSAPIDVAMVLVDDPSMWAEAEVLSGDHVYPAFGASGLELQLQNLDNLGVPIRTLYLMAHANDAGDLMFRDPKGHEEIKKPSVIAATYSGLHLKNPPATVSIRGCRLGQAPSELASFAGWVGAQSASASNCYYVQGASGPVTLGDGTTVLAQSDLKDAAADAEFQKLFDQMVAVLLSRQCVAPLAKGESWPAARKKVVDAYFASGAGQISTAYVNKSHTDVFDRSSTCVKDLPAGQGSAAGCVMVTATAPAPTASQSPTPPVPPAPPATQVPGPEHPGAP